MKQKLSLSAPWNTFYKEVKAMFAGDSEVKVLYDEDEIALKIYVDNPDKADALEVLLPDQEVFGNVILSICIIPSNKDVTPVSDNLFERAFDGNSAFKSVEVAKLPYETATFTYVIFHKQVVQFFNDNMGDFYGNMNTLYENIAREIFIPQNGVFYCTDAETVNAPLGEWP